MPGSAGGQANHARLTHPQTNQPEQVRLLSLDAETAASNFGQDQLRFRTDRGDLYVSVAVGAVFARMIAEQAIQAGELVEIAKREVAIGSRKTIRWELTRVGPTAGEQPDGSFAVPLPPAAPRPPATATVPATASARAQWADTLLKQTNALTDVLADALRHSSQHGGLVKSEDVRSLMLSAFINLSKRSEGNHRAA